MTVNSRRKGSSFEREVVKRAIAVGLTAERTAPMQSASGDELHSDVLINGEIRLECKHHIRISGWPQIITAALCQVPCGLTVEQQGWLRGNAALILKETGWPEPMAIIQDGERYYSMTLLEFLRRLKERVQPSTL